MSSHPILIDSDSDDGDNDHHNHDLRRQPSQPVSITSKTTASSQTGKRDASSPDLCLPSFQDLFWRNGSRQRGISVAGTFLDPKDASPARNRTLSNRTGSLRRITSLPTKSPSHAALTRRVPPEVIEIGSDSIVVSSDRGADSEPELVPHPTSPILSQFSLARPSQSLASPVRDSTSTRSRALLQAEEDARRAGPSRPAVTIVLDSSPYPSAEAARRPAADRNETGRTFRLVSSPPPPSSPVVAAESIGQATSTDALPPRRNTSLLDALDALQTLQEAREPVDDDDDDDDIDNAMASPTRPKHGKRPKAQSSSPEKRKKRSRPGATANPAGSSARLCSSDVEIEALPRDRGGAGASVASRLEKAAAARTAKEAERRTKRLEREAKKAERERAAADKKRWNEANKLRRSKSDTMKELTVEFDDRLCAGTGNAAMLKPCFETIKGRMEADGAAVTTFAASSASLLPLIRFRRRIKARLDPVRRSFVPLDAEVVEPEKVIVVLLEGKEVVQMVEDATLLARIQAVRDSVTPQHQIFVLVQGLHRHFGRLKANENRAYTARIRSQLASSEAVGSGATASRRTASAPAATATVAGAATALQDGVEMALLRLQVAERCFLVHANGLVDLTEWICTLTGDISLRPYKVMRGSYLSFCASGGGQGVGVGGRASTGADERETFRLMLTQIPRVTSHVSESIMAEYPTLQTLYEAYHACADQDAIDTLLSDCQVGTNVNGTLRAANRRGIGPQLSKRIAAVLMGQDPLALVGGPI